VIGSTSGTRFLSARGVQMLKRELLPRATLVMPNWPEAEALSGLRIDSFAAAEAAARAIADACGCAVLVKGGHGPGGLCRDCLVQNEGPARWYSSPRVSTRNSHGTGCVLSAAIALQLSRGLTLTEAVAAARQFLQRSLRRHRAMVWGGAGPAFPGA
jgi:hydroxymethylpyrimidine/phosphomethylpyrimidine kinase